MSLCFSFLVVPLEWYVSVFPSLVVTPRLWEGNCSSSYGGPGVLGRGARYGMTWYHLLHDESYFPFVTIEDFELKVFSISLISF